MPEQKFLISDIGGTNIRLAWFEGDPRQRRDETIYRLDATTNRPYEILPAIKTYAKKINQSFAAACLGLAGQVQNDQVQITNRPDRVFRKDVAAALNLDVSKVLLVNDMPPHLAGVDYLLPAELTEICAGKLDRTGNRAVLMPGTGVGTGGAVYVAENLYKPFPSEGGHLDFAPRDQQQYDLLKHLQPMAEKHLQNHVSNEFVFCGEGIRRIFVFLARAESTDGVPPSEEITTAVAAGNLPQSDLRQQTIELYLKILGARSRKSCADLRRHRRIVSGWQHLPESSPFSHPSRFSWAFFKQWPHHASAYDGFHSSTSH